MTKPLQHLVTPEGTSLQAKVDAFACGILRRYPTEYLSILSSNRNLVIAAVIRTVVDGNFIECLKLREECMEFLAGDEWIAGVSANVNGTMVSVWSPKRHGDIFSTPAFKEAGGGDGGEEQGFAVYKHGSLRHVDREYAFKLASANGQLHRLADESLYHGNELYSEDLWIF